MLLHFRIIQYVLEKRKNLIRCFEELKVKCKIITSKENSRRSILYSIESSTQMCYTTKAEVKLALNLWKISKNSKRWYYLPEIILTTKRTSYLVPFVNLDNFLQYSHNYRKSTLSWVVGFCPMLLGSKLFKKRAQWFRVP